MARLLVVLVCVAGGLFGLASSAHAQNRLYVDNQASYPVYIIGLSAQPRWTEEVQIGVSKIQPSMGRPTEFGTFPDGRYVFGAKNKNVITIWTRNVRGDLVMTLKNRP